MSLSSRGIDPNLMTKSQVLPWLSSRFNLSRSRTFWIFIAVAMVIVLLFNNSTYIYTLNMLAGMIVVVFLFALKMFLKSAASVFIMLIAFFAEYGLLKSEFWLAAGGSLNPLAKLFVEDVLVLLPLGVFFVLELALQRLPTKYFDDKIKAAILSWAGLRRVTTLIMIVASSAAAVAVTDVLDRLVVPRVVRAEIKELLTTAYSIPVDKKAVVETHYGHRTKDPATGKFIYDHNEQMRYSEWRGTLGSAVGGAAYFKGTKVMVPRLMIFLFGFGAYAAFAAFIVALTRNRDLKSGAILFACGVGGSAVLHVILILFSSVPDMTPAMALLALVPGFVLLAICVKAIDTDHRGGFADTQRLLGTSFAVPRGR